MTPISADIPEEWLLHFSVRDTGIGIPVDKQHRLFKSFQQVDASTTRHYGGTGLGWPSANVWSELMGGKIWVESDAGKGATFHFTIEAKAAVRALPAAVANPATPIGRQAPTRVEDNATKQRLIWPEGRRQWGMS